MWNLIVISAFLLSALATWMILPKVILISYKKKLFDYNDGRKVHSGAVPRLGGVSFTPAIIISLALATGFAAFISGSGHLSGGLDVQPSMGLALCALLLLYLEGLTDDLVGVGYKAKFAMQAVCACMVVASGIWVDDLYGLFGIHALPKAVGMPLTAVIIVYVINAVNLIDGIDGLASGLSIIALFFMGSLFMSSGLHAYAAIAFAGLGTLLPFFYFNVFGSAERRRKIFMGDCGSQTIGLVIGTLAVKLGMSGAGQAGESVGIPNALVVAFSLIMIPCLDVIRVMVHRLRHGKNPFLPDMNHIHHKLLALGMSHHTAMIVILALASFFALLNLSLTYVTDINIILAIDIFLWCAFHLWISSIIKKNGNKLEPANRDI